MGTMIAIVLVVNIAMIMLYKWSIQYEEPTTVIIEEYKEK